MRGKNIQFVFVDDLLILVLRELDIYDCMIYAITDMHIFKFAKIIKMLVDNITICWSVDGAKLSIRACGHEDDGVVIISRDEYRLVRKFFMHVLTFIRCELLDVKSRFALMDTSNQIDEMYNHITEMFKF